MAERQPQQPEMGQPEQFRLDTTLSMVSGIGFAGTDREEPLSFGELNGMARFMTGDETVEPPQLPRISDEINGAIIVQNPLLKEILKGRPKEPPLDASEAIQDEYRKEIVTWHNGIMEKYGDWMGDPITVRPIDVEGHTVIDVHDELRMAREQVIGKEVIKLSEGLEDVQTPQDLLNKAEIVSAAEPVTEDSPKSYPAEGNKAADMSEEVVRQSWAKLAYTSAATPTGDGASGQKYLQNWYAPKAVKPEPYNQNALDEERNNHSSAWRDSQQHQNPDNQANEQ